MDFDVVPIGEVTDDGAVALTVIGFEVVERLVREDDAKTECIVRPVALEHGDARLRPCFLHQARKIEPGRASADDVDLHARFPRTGPRLQSRQGVHIRLEINPATSLKFEISGSKDILWPLSHLRRNGAGAVGVRGQACSRHRRRTRHRPRHRGLASHAPGRHVTVLGRSEAPLREAVAAGDAAGLRDRGRDRCRRR